MSTNTRSQGRFGRAWFGRLRPRPRPPRSLEAGMTTAEYAVGTMAAVAFAVVLLAVVRSDAVTSALTGIITTALSAAS